MPSSPETENPEGNPIWDLYDEMRTARLNVKCIEYESRRFKKAQFWIEVITGVAASSSIGGFWFFQNLYGGYIWKTIGALAVICSVLKPILKLPDKLKHLQELLISYKILDHDLHCIAVEVKQKRKFDAILQKDFLKALDRKGELVKKSADSTIDPQAERMCHSEVNRELPVSAFYIPD